MQLKRESERENYDKREKANAYRRQLYDDKKALIITDYDV